MLLYTLTTTFGDLLLHSNLVRRPRISAHETFKNKSSIFSNNFTVSYFKSPFHSMIPRGNRKKFYRSFFTTVLHLRTVIKIELGRKKHDRKKIWNYLPWVSFDCLLSCHPALSMPHSGWSFPGFFLGVNHGRRGAWPRIHPYRGGHGPRHRTGRGAQEGLRRVRQGDSRNFKNCLLGLQGPFLEFWISLCVNIYGNSPVLKL